MYSMFFFFETQFCLGKRRNINLIEQPTEKYYIAIKFNVMQSCGGWLHKIGVLSGQSQLLLAGLRSYLYILLCLYTVFMHFSYQLVLL